ncbi:MAG: hypothetical protein ACI3XA_06755 [Clostridia bacterium]
MSILFETPTEQIISAIKDMTSEVRQIKEILIKCFNADVIDDDTEKLVALVECAENTLKKTYRDDFLEKFPNCRLKPDGTPTVCRDTIYGIDTVCSGKCYGCWNKPMKEDKNG